jgi:hypothetical protein
MVYLGICEGMAASLIEVGMLAWMEMVSHTETTMVKVAFIGVGNVGAPMVRNLVKACQRPISMPVGLVWI